MSKTKARQLMAAMNKLLGKDAVRLGSDPKYVVEYLPTGELPMDILFQGGIPRGRFVVITGAFSTLKTYIALKTIAATQQAGGLCALIDTERAFDPAWATELGVDVEALLMPPTTTGEEAVDAAQVLVQNGVDLIVFDSIAATLPQQEREKRMTKESQAPGMQARLMSAACRRLTSANTGRTGFIWINQLREQIGVTFGPTEKGPGGRAMPFYASMIVNIRQSGAITVQDETFDGDKYQSSKKKIGQTFRAVIEKSKLNQPHREIFFDFRLEDPVGLDILKFIFGQGVELGLVSKRGNTWEYGGIKAVGKAQFLAKLGADEEAQAKLEDAIRAVHGLPSLRRRGKSAPRSQKAAATKSPSSKRAAPVRIPTQEPAASSVTVLRRKTSSKSSTPARRMR